MPVVQKDSIQKLIPILELKEVTVTPIVFALIIVTTALLPLPAATAPSYTSYVVTTNAILIVLMVHIPTTLQIPVKAVVVVALLVLTRQHVPAANIYFT